MAIRDDWAAGEVLTSTDLNDTFDAKANLASPTFTGTVDMSGATVIGAGMDFVAAGSMSAVSVNIDNVFTADYENYLLIIRANGVSAQALRMVLRDSTPADIAASSYRNNQVFWIGTSASASNSTDAYVEVSAVRATNPGYAKIDILGPNLSVKTGFIIDAIDPDTTMTHRRNVCYYDVTTVAAGIRIFTPSTTITGHYYLYGYRAA